MSDLISRRKAFEYFVTLWECIGTIMDRDEWEDVCMTTANEIPSAQPDTSRIENVLHGKSPEEQYDFLWWLMQSYGMQFSDTRIAVIEWLRGEPMSDLISRQAAVDTLMEILDRPNHAEFLYTDEICKALEDLPSAQPERKTGRWYDVGSLSCRCSACGCKSQRESMFCPNCGARMEADT